MEDGETEPPALPMEEDLALEQPHLSPPRLDAENPREEAMRQELDALKIEMRSIKESAAQPPVSHVVPEPQLLHPVKEFTGKDPDYGVHELLSEVNAKATASALPKARWPAIALASMTPEIRKDVNQKLDGLRQASSIPNDWVPSWGDLVNVLKASAWAHKETALSLRTQLYAVELQQQQTVQVATRKLEGLFAKLSAAENPLAESEKVFVLQRAVGAVLKDWPLNANPITLKPWETYEELSQHLLEKDLLTPERRQRPPRESSFQQQGRKREKPAYGPTKYPRSSSPVPKKPRGSASSSSSQLSPELRQQLMSEGKCFRCQQQGHRASDVVSSKHGPKFVCPSRSSDKPPVNRKPSASNKAIP